MSVTTDVGTTANQVIDLKGPLKGKGGSLPQWLADVSQRLEQVYQEMELLAVESKSIQGRRFGLHVYWLRSGRQLRWRMTSGVHATWTRVAPLLNRMPEGLAQWYRQAQLVATVLNHREQVLRYERKTVERLITAASALGDASGARVSRAYRMGVGRGVGGGRPHKVLSLDLEVDAAQPQPASPHVGQPPDGEST